MKTTTSLKFSKSVFKFNEGTYIEEQERYLDCELTVKGNDAEKVADIIMEIMEMELANNGYEFKFARCPDREERMYFDCMSIPFEIGYMTEYREAIKEAYRVAKEKYENIEVIEVDQKEDYSINKMTLNNGYHVEYAYSKWYLYNTQGECVTHSREWNTSNFNKHMLKVAETYQLNNSNLSYMLELYKEVLGNRALVNELQTLLELIIEFNNNDYFKTILNTYCNIKTGEETTTYARELQVNKDFLKKLSIEVLEIVEKNSKFLLEEISMGVINSIKKILSTHEPVAEKKYNIWLGTENLKGKN